MLLRAFQFGAGLGTHVASDLARISAVNDRSRGVIDEDGSLQVFTPRLSAQGGLDLLEWLRTHEAQVPLS